MVELLRRYLPVLFVADGVLVLAHLAWGSSSFWNLDKEHNLPTWLSGVQLVFLGLAALDCHGRERATGRRFFPPSGSWAALAVVFFYLSLDETAVIHEGVLRNELRDLLPPSSLWISLLPWQIIFGPLLAIVAIVMLALFLTRFARTRPLYAPAVAGLACWGGAVLMEGLAKPLFMVRGWYHQEAALEEGLELFGAALLLLALCRYGEALARGPVAAVDLKAQYRRFVAAAVVVTLFVAAGASIVAAVSLRNSAWLYRHGASQLQKRGNYAEAIVAYQEALKREPGKDAAAVTGVALCHYRLEHYPDALDWYGRALELAPQDARLWTSRGAVQHRLGRFRDAEDSYRRAIELQPHYARPIAFLGLALEKQRREDEARTAYEQALRLSPEDSTARRGLERLRAAAEAAAAQ